MTLKFLSLQGAPYIYDISRLRVNVHKIMTPKCLYIHDSLGVKAVQNYNSHYLLHIQDRLNSLLEEARDFAQTLVWLASDGTTSQIILQIPNCVLLRKHHPQTLDYVP
jgi:hypothetical protein